MSRLVVEHRVFPPSVVLFPPLPKFTKSKYAQYILCAHQICEFATTAAARARGWSWHFCQRMGQRINESARHLIRLFALHSLTVICRPQSRYLEHGKFRPWSSFRPPDYDLDTDSRRFTLILVSLSALIRVPFELVAETTINAQIHKTQVRSLYYGDWRRMSGR